MQTVSLRSVTIFLALSTPLIGLGAQTFPPADTMPATASEYARLVEPALGVVPTIDCGEGVRIPIHVEGVEVFEDQERFACDTPDFRCDWVEPPPSP